MPQPFLKRADTKLFLVGMVHLGPLLQDRVSLTEVEKHALVDASRLIEAGFDGIMVENFGDTPFYPDRVPPHTIAAFTRIAARIADLLADTEVCMGINVLRNDAQAAIAVAAAVDADFVRVNVHAGAALTDQGLIQGRAYETIRYRDSVAPNVALFADVRVKHAVPLVPRSLTEEARELVGRARADGLIVSGVATGAPVQVDRLREVREATEGVAPPVWVGSGVSRANLGTIVRWADGAIVGTSIKEGGQVSQPIDPERARALVQAVHAAQGD